MKNSSHDIVEAVQRLAGSEEILPIPEMGEANDHAILQELEKSIRSSLSKVQYSFSSMQIFAYRSVKNKLL